MMKLKIRLLVMLWILLSVPSRAQNYTPAQVRQQINAVASRMKTMTCDFVQTKSVAMLKSKLVSRGHMYYAQPNKLRWEYTTPYSYTFLLNGQTVWMKNEKGSNRVNVAQSKMFKEITRIMMSSVVGSCVSNSRDFNVTLQGKGNNWKAIMKPKRNPMKQMFKAITVYFDMKRAMVIGVKMIEQNNDATSIVLQNTKLNLPINEKVFSVR